MLNFTALPYIHITQLQTAVFYIIGKMIKVEQLKRLYTRHTSCLLSVFQLKCIAVFYLFNCSDNLAQFVSCHMLRPKLTHAHTHIFIYIQTLQTVTHHALWQLLGAPGASRGQSPKSVNIARHLAAARQRVPNPSSRKQLTAAAKPCRVWLSLLLQLLLRLPLRGN